MSTEKIKAIRKALINAPLDTINAFTEKYNLGDISLQNLAEYLVNNGDCGLDYDITESLMNSFIDFADKHSLTTRDKIEDRVNECDFDFLMDDWDYIWDNLLCSAKFRDNVVYVVEYECEGPKWEHEKAFTLCSTWDKAQEIFASDKEDADISMHGRCDEWNTPNNTPTHYLIEAGDYNYWYEVIVSKKEIE
jgi:hypothetical protein